MVRLPQVLRVCCCGIWVTVMLANAEVTHRDVTPILDHIKETRFRVYITIRMYCWLTSSVYTIPPVKKDDGRQRDGDKGGLQQSPEGPQQQGQVGGRPEESLQHGRTFSLRC